MVGILSVLPIFINLLVEVSDTVVGWNVLKNKGEIFVQEARIPHGTIQHHCKTVGDFSLQIEFICKAMTESTFQSIPPQVLSWRAKQLTRRQYDSKPKIKNIENTTFDC